MLEVKQFLKEVRWECQEIQRLKLKREEIRSRLIPGSPILKQDMVQTSGSGDVLGETEAAINDLDNMIQYDIHRLTMDQIRAIKIIEQIESSAYRQILMDYYCPASINDMQELKDIADRMNYSYDSIRHMHGDALLEAQEVYIKTKKRCLHIW